MTPQRYINAIVNRYLGTTADYLEVCVDGELADLKALILDRAYREDAAEERREAAAMAPD